ncbi:MAG TPA: hypothetical protein VIY48_16960, partial [Candidatus Paceibacterota bacterium]
AYFGRPSDPNFDATKSIAWLLDTHNTEGFPARWLYQWGQLMTGDESINSKMVSGLNTVQTNVDTELDSWVEDFRARGDAAGAAYVNAFLAQMGKLPGGGGSPEPLEGKAAGGWVRAGTTYIVGEMGPELFTPSFAGYIVPNYAAGGRGGITTTVGIDNIHVHLDFPNVTRLPENPNEYSARAADAMMIAMQRRMKQRGLKTEIH